MKAHTICLVGNPNCGKTTLFNELTGARQQVGNWPGVTVERKTGTYQGTHGEVRVVDLPGVYSLAVTSVSSLDERIAREFVLSGQADLVVNILDASNLERNLYLTAQLLEMRVPMVVALNMMDVARDRRIRIDVGALSARLGCPVVPLVASRGEGVRHLRAEIDRMAGERRAPNVDLGYRPEIEHALSELKPILERLTVSPAADVQWLAVKLLEGDEGARAMVPASVRQAAERIAEHTADRADEDCDILIADSRYGFANALVRATLRREGVVRRTVSDRIDRVVLHRLAGIPIFLAVMYLLFLFTINFGSAFIDFFDQFAGTLLVDGTAHMLEGVGNPPWLTALLADGIGGGIQTVATFIPIIVGFGCNVPAIMATRTLENRRDRILTVMMAPFMSCGARLPVYALFAAAMFPTGGQNIVFALYLIGIGFAVITGLVLKKTLLKGETAPFVMELPPYHLPTLRGILLRTWERLREFMYRAGRIIVAVVVVLSFFNSWGTDGSFGNQDTDRSVLAAAGKSLTPALAPMGISEENWPATVGMLTGILAKETVVGTLNALYGSLAEESAAEDGEAQAFDLWTGIGAAFATIPANLADLADSIADPLGLGIVQTDDLEAAAELQEVDMGTFGAMASRFDGRIGAFAYLLAVLLYMPCVSAVAAIYRETGPRWAVFASLWTTGLGYGAAVVVYQAGTFDRDPLHAAAWIGAILLLFAVTLLAFRMAREGDAARQPATAGAAE